MVKIGVGIVGTGDRAIGYLQDTFEEMTDDGRIEVVGVADVNPVRAREAQKDLRASKWFEDYRELLEEDDLQAVYVMTPESVHADIVVDALDAGLHVYCEKPMATTLEACNRIVEAAKRSEGIFFPGLNARYGENVVTMRRVIEEGQIGEVQMVWARRFVEGAKFWHRWHRKKINSGGLLVHKGCHFMDQMNLFSGGRPRYVSAFGGMDVYRPREDAPRRCLECDEHCDHYLDIEADERRKRYFLDAEQEDGYIRDLCVYAPGSDVYDNAVVALEYDNSVRGTYMECHFASVSDVDSESGAVGDEGLIKGSFRQDKTLEIRLENRKNHTVELIPSKGGRNTVVMFIEHIEQGLEPECDEEVGWDSAVVGVAGQKSAAARKTVEISNTQRTIEFL